MRHNIQEDQSSIVNCNCNRSNGFTQDKRLMEMGIAPPGGILRLFHRATEAPSARRVSP